jgi:uncharacterized protein YifE (UPF0438 family)
MTVETLKDLVQVLRITPATFAKNIGINPTRFKRTYNKTGDHTVTDEVLLKALVDRVPDLILGRIQSMHERLERLQTFGPLLHKLKGELNEKEKEEKRQAKFEERFGSSSTDSDLSDQEAGMTAESKEDMPTQESSA